MVKSTFAIATVATIFSIVNAQTPTIPSDLAGLASSLPTDIANDISAAASSLLKNPSAVQSLIGQASAQGSLLPTQYQASYYSVLAEASKTANAVQGKSTSTSMGSTTYPVTYIVCALTITGVLASLL